MTHQSDPRLLVVHTLRLKGFAEPDVVAGNADLELSVVASIIGELIDDGLVSYREGRLSGYQLTPPGRHEDERLVAEELEQTGARPTVEDAYRRFLEFNQELLAVCTSWQLRDGADGTPVVNDHADPEHDRRAVEALVGLHDRVRPVVADLRAVLARFGGHGDRLRHALERVVAGDHDYFTKPMFPSYHSIWFELHEDLLATLGIDRATEGSI